MKNTIPMALRPTTRVILTRHSPHSKMTTSEFRVPEIPEIPSLSESEAYCRKITRSRRENFVVVSFLLPRRLHQDFCNVYTYCRLADDLADEIVCPTESLHQLDIWQEHLESCYNGQPKHIAFVALQATIRRFNMPRQPFLDLLTAFRRDQTQTRYETLDDLLHYCRYSANPVGRLILALADSLDDHRAAFSDDICTGLQLANHWQDIAADFRKGRIYLPQDRCRELGVTEEMLKLPKAPPELRRLLREQVAIAADFFQRGRPLLEEVPRWLRVDLKLFIDGGLAALQAIRRADYDVLAKDCKVRRRTQLRLLVNATCRHWLDRQS
ncbi:MAG: squalene synthase HpnC [Pirellulaceae bacterium]